MNREEAFKKVLYTRGLATKLGKPVNYFTNMRKAYEKGRVSDDLMKQVLTDAGYIKVVDEVWIEGQYVENNGAKKPGAIAPGT